MESSPPSPPVKILETTRVTPPSSATEFSLPLTFFDTLWFKFPPVKRLFFYQFPESSTTPFYFDSITLPKLKHSLSLTLLHFLPIAGNLTWPSNAPKPLLIYTLSNGVSLTVAESNSDFNRLAGNNPHEAVELHSFVPDQLWVSESDDASEIIALQITLFPNKGFSIGITAHHAVLDGNSTTMFMKAWAYICRQGTENSCLPSELTPYFDRSSIKDPDGLDIQYVNEWLISSSSDETNITERRSLKPLKALDVVLPDLVRATFELTREDIKKLRDKVLSKRDGAAKSLHLSTFVLLYAYTAVCLVKARGDVERDHEGERTVFYAFAADYRSRVEPPLPANYFGNCVGGRGGIVEARNFMDDENGLVFAAEMLSDAIEGLAKMGVYEDAKTWVSIINTVCKTDSGTIQMISVAGSPKFEIYSTDFGWGKPKKVEIVSIDRNKAVALAESRDGNGGVEIGLALERREMEIFASLFTDGLKATF